MPTTNKTLAQTALEWKDADLKIEEVHGGLKVTQHGKSYLARDWKLNQPVVDMVNLALGNGFFAVWRNNHPRKQYFYLEGQRPPKGIHHLMFSRSHEAPWIFGFGGEANPPHGDFYTFNNKLKTALDKAGVRYETGKRGGEDARVQLEDGAKALRFIAANYEVCFRSRSGQS